MSGMPHGAWRVKKQLYRKIIADLNRHYPHMTKNWKKLHPKVFKGSWKG